VFCAPLSLFDRRKANKSSSDGLATETRKHNNQPPIYELAGDVTGDVNSLDKNGRLVTTNHANPTRQDDYDVEDGYSSVSPVQVSQDDSKPESPTYYNLVDNKRTVRTCQHGAGKPAAGVDDSTEAGKTREPILTSINDFTLIDNAIYNE